MRGTSFTFREVTRPDEVGIIIVLVAHSSRMGNQDLIGSRTAEAEITGLLPR